MIDHIPEATTTTWDSPVLVCSCGWDSEVAREAWADHLPDFLDAAWVEAEAALPEGWTLRLSNGGHPERYAATAIRLDDGWEPQKDIRAPGPTPTAALRALVAKLREAQG